ncbi:MAG TPA: carboxymuconolactone decarboxylase family protein [Candidatus Binatus sp.]|jgi:AhpD family alkylhydroperoxidase|nr:carboxymuconolactone decarboxylase family protein [Candidatus Binatus sp.]
MVEKTMMDILRAECPGAADAMQAFFGALLGQPRLDEKTKQLVYIAAAASAGHVRGVPVHVARAKAIGATREEVLEALLLTLPAAGFGPLSQCLPAAMAVFDG